MRTSFDGLANGTDISLDSLWYSLIESICRKAIKSLYREPSYNGQNQRRISIF